MAWRRLRVARALQSQGGKGFVVLLCVLFFPGKVMVY